MEVPNTYVKGAGAGFSVGEKLQFKLSEASLLDVRPQAPAEKHCPAWSTPGFRSPVFGACHFKDLPLQESW